MALEKAKFINNKDNKVIVVQFNPSSLSVISDAMVLEQKTQQFESDNAILNIGGIKSRQLRVSLMLDTYKNNFTFSSLLSSMFKSDNEPKSVKQVVDNFESFMNASSEISFIWGKIVFTGFINNISTKYEMFSSDGTPVRANIDISMEENVYISQGYSDMEFNDEDLDIDDNMNEEQMLSKIVSDMSNGV